MSCLFPGRLASGWGTVDDAGNPVKAEELKTVTWAYSILRNRTMRAVYDAVRHMGSLRNAKRDRAEVCVK